MTIIKSNNSGEIPNIGDLRKIKHKYLPIISKVKDIYTKVLGKNLTSLYVRGSVSNGQDTRFSDLDFVAITEREISKNQENKLLIHTVNLQNKYKSVNGFELASVSLRHLVRSKDYINLRINLKTSSVLIKGKDITNLLPKIIPGKQLSIQIFNYTNDEYLRLKKYFSSSNEESYLGKNRPVEFWCGWMMRVLSRSGIGILMLKEKVYTNDIIYISKRMVKEYPKFRPLFSQAKKWVIEPTYDRKKVENFLNKYVGIYFKFWKKLLD
jgi:uncharacterized protein